MTDLGACMDRHPSGREYGRHALTPVPDGLQVYYGPTPAGWHHPVASHAAIDPLWALAAAEMVAADEAARRNERAASGLVSLGVRA